MQNRQINTTKNEICIAIGLAANEIAEKEENMDKQMKIMDIGARICSRVILHLTGEKKFPEEDVKFYEFVEIIADSLSGGATLAMTT